jgi:hypothetical protein
MFLDDHDPVAMTAPPSAMVAAVMPVLGTRAMMTVMMAMIATTLDHDGLRARNRRRSDNDRTKRSQDNSKLLHSSPPH